AGRSTPTAARRWFASMAGMKASALELLQSVFGYPGFRGQQQAVIEHLGGGGDALVLMPTGGGVSQFQPRGGGAARGRTAVAGRRTEPALRGAGTPAHHALPRTARTHRG